MNESSRTTLQKRHWLTNPKVVPYVFIAPFLIFFLVIYLYPFISTILMSFQKIDGPNSVQWIGTANYEKMFNRNFKQALATTFRYAFWDNRSPHLCGDPQLQQRKIPCLFQIGFLYSCADFHHRGRYRFPTCLRDAAYGTGQPGSGALRTAAEGLADVCRHG